jgi:hypothetical protein
MKRKLLQVAVVIGLLWGFGASAKSATTAPHSMDDPGCSWTSTFCVTIGNECAHFGGICTFTDDFNDCYCLCPDGNACYDQ